ncbi:MAG TPA: rRNA maturation RNase YbeY [Flavipsychrobacter sp.]|nr:rRNA maturation RNase YbeY [Flavipsychrobacter sp.]
MVKFYEHNVSAKLKDRRRLSAFLDKTVNSYLKKLKKIQLTYIFCDDEYLLEINKQFLNHDTFTDIVTFDLSENRNELTGEIYISVDRIVENAEKFNTKYQNELHRVIFHGALHLCGFKDKTKDDITKMRSKENACLEQYFKD